MDIQTKDGILLRNIPDGTPDEEIKARIEKIRGGAVSQPKGGDSESSGRNAAIAGRAAWNGAASIADVAADPMGAVRRMFTGEQSPLQQAPDALLKGVNAVLGGGFNGETIKPETSGEKMLDATVSGATGALAGPGGGVKSAATALMAGAGAGAGGELAK